MLASQAFLDFKDHQVLLASQDNLDLKVKGENLAKSSAQLDPTLWESLDLRAPLDPQASAGTLVSQAPSALPVCLDNLVLRARRESKVRRERGERQASPGSLGPVSRHQRPPAPPDLGYPQSQDHRDPRGLLASQVNRDLLVLREIRERMVRRA